jgi:SRSO17 transposase
VAPLTKRLPVAPAPGPLEAYAAHFDPLFSQRPQRAGFRRYLEGLLLPAERTKTLTALANTAPVGGAQHARAQGLQWFLSESTWDPDAVNAQRLAVLTAEPLTAPSDAGVLVIDEHGDRKWGRHTAHVGRQWLANIGKTDNGVVSVTSLWADERVYWPVDDEPYTPAMHFAQGTADPTFRTKLQIARELVADAVAVGIPFRAVVADSFYGEDAAFKRALRALGVGYVLALKPSHAWWHRQGEVGAVWQVAEHASWQGVDAPGAWVQVERSFRDGHAEAWWALEVVAGPYGPHRLERAFVVTDDPQTLPELSTWYLVTNLPAPGSERGPEPGALSAADLAEVVRLDGLRMWVEHSYKQTKHTLGWSQYQVRADIAIRRHWQLVCCAFSFCWYHQGQLPDAQPAMPDAPASTSAAEAGRGENQRRATADDLVASRPAHGASVAGALAAAVALLARVVRSAPTTPVAGAA